MAGSPEEERTAPEACRSSNASSSSSGSSGTSSSSSSSSSSDDDKPAEPPTTTETVSKLDGPAPPEEPAVDGTSSGVANARQEQQHQHKVKDVQETGMLSLRSDLMSTLMVAGGVAAAIVVAAAFLANKALRHHRPAAEP